MNLQHFTAGGNPLHRLNAIVDTVNTLAGLVSNNARTERDRGHFRRGFFALLTGLDSPGWYTFTEMYCDCTGPAVWTAKAAGRGTAAVDLAANLSGSLLPMTGRMVWMWEVVADTHGIKFFFEAAAGVPVATVIMYAGDVGTIGTPTVPDGWSATDGEELHVDTQPGLYAVIGFKFGGSGSYFAKPDTRQKFWRGQYSDSDDRLNATQRGYDTHGAGTNDHGDHVGDDRNTYGTGGESVPALPPIGGWSHGDTDNKPVYWTGPGLIKL